MRTAGFATSVLPAASRGAAADGSPAENNTATCHDRILIERALARTETTAGAPSTLDSHLWRASRASTVLGISETT